MVTSGSKNTRWRLTKCDVNKTNKVNNHNVSSDLLQQGVLQPRLVQVCRSSAQPDLHRPQHRWPDVCGQNTETRSIRPDRPDPTPHSGTHLCNTGRSFPLCRERRASQLRSPSSHSELSLHQTAAPPTACRGRCSGPTMPRSVGADRSRRSGD